MIIVVGSGPTGISAANALLDGGCAVTLVDAGLDLEPERRRQQLALASRPAEDWPAEFVAALREQPPANLGGVPKKYTYGSDFPYREVEDWIPTEQLGTSTQPSFARGGFSSVWGSAVMPYLDADLGSWPIGADDLAPHYRAVADWMPISAEPDGLHPEFPIHAEHPVPLERSAQARALMRDLERRREALERDGIRAGWSRLAVRANAVETRDGRAPGCAYCGMCMSGCPYRLIYDAATTLEELERHPDFHYEPDVVVERVSESGNEAVVTGRRRSDRGAVEFRGDRVLLGCGVVSTTKLLLSSLDAIDRPVTIRDSQYFLVPLLRLRGVPAPRDEALHSLAQLFLELRDPDVARFNVHLQVYGFNDLFVSVLDGMAGPLRGLARPLIDLLLARLMVIQGYLHSDESPGIRATLRRSADGERLELAAEENPETRRTLRRVMRRLLRHSGALRALPAWPALQVAPPGRGFHSGGSFPMRDAPGEFESDLLGRPTGFERVHAVDSTTFPSIPSTTITYTAMANAHRIASAVAALPR